MSNLSYYCEANHCNSRIKQLVHDYCKKMDQEADIPSLRSLQAEQINLHNLITELSVKLDKLYTQNSSLKDQVDKTSELINVSMFSLLLVCLLGLRVYLSSHLNYRIKLIKFLILLRILISLYHHSVHLTKMAQPYKVILL